jgi:Ca2+-transporting ATPase
MNIIPALALGAEPPVPVVMERRLRRALRASHYKGLLLPAGVVLGPVQSLTAMSAFYFIYWTNGYGGQWLDLPAKSPCTALPQR